MRSLASSLVVLLVAAGCGGDPSGTGATISSGGTGTTSASGGATTAGSDTGGVATTTQTEVIGGTGGTGGVTGGAGGVTGGTGGATGGTGGVTGGTGGATTTSTTSTTSTSTGMPGPCTWGDDCGAGYYCEAPGCAAGNCTPKPAAAGLSPSPDPVCGCDGITYWSPDVAASKGESIAVPGACAMPILCGPGLVCPSGMRCSRVVPDAASCSPDATGECWGTALSCSLSGPHARACTTGTCELQCSLIQSENPWYEDPSCN